MARLKIALAACIFLAGAHPEAAGDESLLMPEHTYTDDSFPIRVEIGISFHIALDSNATTGYCWRVADITEAGVIEDRGGCYFPPSTARKGAGGKEIWTFLAVGSGQTTVRLEYVRPWEKGGPPARSRQFTVIVGGID